jgi:hypothetical protein
MASRIALILFAAFLVGFAPSEALAHGAQHQHEVDRGAATGGTVPGAFSLSATSAMSPSCPGGGCCCSQKPASTERSEPPAVEPQGRAYDVLLAAYVAPAAVDAVIGRSALRSASRPRAPPVLSPLSR